MNIIARILSRPFRRSCFMLGLSITAALFLIADPGMGPVSANVRLTGALSREAVLLPGDVFEEVLQVENSGEEEGSVRVYQMDYHFDAEGRSYFEDPGTLARSNAHWIEVDHGVFSVEPRTSHAVPFTVRVPNDSHLVGTYWSVIMVELLTSLGPEGDRDELAEQEQVQLGFEQVWRYAVQIVTQIGDTGEARLGFHNPQVIPTEDGGAMLQVDLVNEGERWLNPDVWAELYHPSGELLTRVEGQRQRLYPDTSVRQRLPLQVEEPGVYPLLLLVDNGDEHVFGVNYRINFATP